MESDSNKTNLECDDSSLSDDLDLLESVDEEKKDLIEGYDWTSGRDWGSSSEPENIPTLTDTAGGSKKRKTGVWAFIDEKDIRDHAFAQKSTCHAPGKDIKLSDGSKIDADGSIHFSDSALASRDAGKSVRHEFTDKQGHKHELKIEHGHVYYDHTDISANKIVRNDGAYQTVIYKTGPNKGEIDVKTPEGTYTQKTNGTSIERTVHQGDATYTDKGQEVVVTATDGQKVISLDKQGATVHSPTGAKIQFVNARETAEHAMQHNGSRACLYLDKEGHMVGRLKDGTIIRLLSGNVVSLTKDGIEVQVSQDGKQRWRKEHGAWNNVADPKHDTLIPLTIRKRIHGHVVDLDDDRQFDLKEGTLTGKDHHHQGGRHQYWHCHHGKPPTVVADNGQQISLHGNHFEISSLGHGKPVTWDPDTATLKTAVATLKPDVTTFENGNKITLKGEVLFKNPDGTYDQVSADGSIRFADGTTVSRDGLVKTSDGWSSDDSFDNGSAMSQPEAAIRLASQGDSVAAEVSNRDMPTFNDIGRLVDAQGQVASLMPIFMARGDMNTVAILMQTQGRLDGALSVALPKAQAFALLQQKGVSATNIVAEVADNLYGKSPGQAVSAILEAHHINKPGNKTA